MGYNRNIKTALSILVIVAVSWFFFRQFQKNWEYVQSYDLKIDVPFILWAFCAIVTTYLLATYSWLLTLNSLSDKKITFVEGVATVNTSNLTKYVPGKIWSYALQLYWLMNAGFSKSLILYVNLLNLYITLITSTILGLAYLVVSPGAGPLTIKILLFAGVIILDVLFIKFNAHIFKRLISLLNRIIKRDIGYFTLPPRLIYYLYFINFIAAFCFGIGAYFVCRGIGFDPAGGKIFLVMSSMMIADVIGFLAIIVPGGLGVREGVMYLMLTGVSIPALSLILPIATRITSMLVDIFLGTIGFVLLNKITRTRK
jgi:glycosyltransferase 2 family protein